MAKKTTSQRGKSAKKPKISGIAADRERLYRAAIAHIAFDGFGAAALAHAASAAKIDLPRAKVLFPNPKRDLWQYFLNDTNGQLAEKLSGVAEKNWKIREKIAHGVRKKLEILSPLQEVERKALALGARPAFARAAMKNLYDTCDIIWRSAGDTSVDWNFYTKRALLAGVYTSTLLFWLNDESDGYEDTHRFLSRRIDNVMMIQKIKSAFKNRDAISSAMDLFKKFTA
jgi:ubiquinone biosynthesis protein COQ9